MPLSIKVHIQVTLTQTLQLAIRSVQKKTTKKLADTITWLSSWQS